LGHAAAPVTTPLTVRNRGQWPLSNRQAPGLLMATWLTPKGRRIEDRWLMQPLPEMQSGDQVRLPLTLQLPARPGVYVLAVDVLREHVLRVSQLGNPMGFQRCRVVPAGADLRGYPALDDDNAAPDDLAEISVGPRLEIERRHYWRAALLWFERHPWLGLGADRFRLSYREYVPAAAYDPRARAHSVLLETAADLGLAGLAALAFLALALGWHVRKALQSGDDAAVAAAAALVGLAVHSQVDYFLAYTQVTVVLWPLVGMLGAQARNILGETVVAPEPPP